MEKELIELSTLLNEDEDFPINLQCSDCEKKFPGLFDYCWGIPELPATCAEIIRKFIAE